MTLLEIVEQLKFCGFECEDGKLENNAAFLQLVQIALTHPTLSNEEFMKVFTKAREEMGAPMETVPPFVIVKPN